MRIHGICLVKNEGDIMRYFLKDSARWCDHIYVYDNGSTDATWQIVNEMAELLPQVTPYRQSNVPFDDALRAEVFNEFRTRANPGDWWCRLDADELYIDSPIEFLTHVPRHHHVVWSIHLQYYLTVQDLERFSPEAETCPPEINDTNLPRYYAANASEARFFRHREQLEWQSGAWPRHLGVVTPRRIRLKHLQYRSPAQIQQRLDTRREAAARGWQHFQHSLEASWTQKLADPDDLILDTGDGQYVIDPRRLPRNMENPFQRAVKLLMHGAGVWP